MGPRQGKSFSVASGETFRQNFAAGVGETMLMEDRIIGEMWESMMDEKKLWQDLAEEMVRDWEILPTGSGFVVVSDWVWPNGERIEITVRTVGDREDLYLVTDGGELFNLLFANGVDLTRHEGSLRRLGESSARHGVELVEYQMAKGANESDLSHAIRGLLEALKESAFRFWPDGEEKSKAH